MERRRNTAAAAIATAVGVNVTVGRRASRLKRRVLDKPRIEDAGDSADGRH
jgi:hypothetical protein